MARRLVLEGHQVTMVCGSYGLGRSGLVGPFAKGVRRGHVDGIEVIELGLAYSNYDRFMKRALTFLKFAVKSMFFALSERYDLLFATSTPLTAGIPGIVAKILRRKPFVFEVRDLWPELPREMGVITNPVILALMNWLEWLSYHAADGCIGLSPGIVQGIEKRGVDKGLIAMIPNGSDLSLFYPKNNRAWLPQGCDADDFLAVFTGAHGLANGLDSVLDAGKVLLERGRSDIKFVFVGDGKLKPVLQARAEAEGLDNCLFLDPIPKSELAGLLKAADVGLMILANVPAFYYGTSPNKFFDYIAAGLPVVNNYPGWLADMIKDNNCGMAARPGDAENFADILEEMASERNTLQLMGENARNLAVEKFDRADLSILFVKFLEKYGC